jgi:hypothetical protein
MPKIEIDEEEWNKIQNTRSVLKAIAANPKAAKLVEQAHKMVDPNAPTPKIEAEAPLQEALDTMNKTLADIRKEREEEKTARETQQKLDTIKGRQDAGWAKLRAARWTDEGLKKVQEIMDAKGILDPEDAALIFERDNPPPPPAMPGGTGPWNFLEPASDDGADIKKLIESKGESGPLLDKMIREGLAEVRGSQPRR